MTWHNYKSGLMLYEEIFVFLYLFFFATKELVEGQFNHVGFFSGKIVA
jgi:hypothetical protein